MRQFVVDELNREERSNIENYLKRTLAPGPIEGMFWLSLPHDLLAAPQQGHTDCGPFCTTVELEENAVRFELLVRSRTTLHCSCIAYATRAQQEFVFNFIESMLAEEHIVA